MSIRDWFKLRKKTDSVQAEPVILENEKEEIREEAVEVLEADIVYEAEPAPVLTDMDFSEFWHDIRESERRYMSPPADIKIVLSVQEKLGFRLPDAYVELMKMHNGGLLNRCWYPVKENARTYSDYIQVTGILGIGDEVPYSLCGRFGSEFLLEGHENLKNAGIALMNSISPSRAMLMLDYRNCGADGEPEVLYVNLESGEEKTVAPNFEAFIRGLKTSMEALSDSEN